MTQSIFHQLAAVDVSAHVEKKGKFSYLSWPFALSELQKVDPAATWEVMRFPLPDCPHLLTPVMITPVGVFVEVAVTAGGKRLSQVHPVLDERNNAVKAPNAYEVNKAIMRCLVKAVALHGLGLNVYAGEDLPMNDDDDDTPRTRAKPKMTVVRASSGATTIRVEPPADIKEVRDRVGALFATLEMSTKEARVDFMRRITGKDSGFELADYLDVEEALKSAAAAKVAPDEVQP